MLSITLGGPFGVIMADPPWQYGSPRAMVGNRGRGSNNGQAARIIQADTNQHYPTMALSEIKALPVEAVAAADSLLFMWVTNPFLADGSGVDVVKAWGFTPKSVLTWSKVQTDGVSPSMKTGHWFRSASEHIIFATRGSVKRPLDWQAIPTWHGAKRLPHSVKPEVFYRYAESAYPGALRLEMFARRPRNGWVVWGNESDGSRMMRFPCGGASASS
jgi:N6-adenosine-specific RNA methylase IME4